MQADAICIGCEEKNQKALARFLVETIKLIHARTFAEEIEEKWKKS